MSVAVRFAPSPTGFLHIGNVRTALITWLFAKKDGGSYLLRIDDTDQERSREECVDDIKTSLSWLGLEWDDFARQRDRSADYDRAIQKLKDNGRLYACYETEEELALKRKSLLGRGMPPIYDRAALSLTDEQKKKYEAEGRQPHWRFKLEHAPIVWDDLIRGRVEFNGKDMSDPVLIRADGTPLYHICSVIDDIDFKITHIIRGEDHVSNTASHIQMFEALGAKPPSFAHLALIAGAEGEKLSKRIGSLSIQSLRTAGTVEPMAIVSLLSRLGTSQPIESFTRLEDAVQGFDISTFSRSIAKFDEEELMRINAKILHSMSFDDIKARLEERGFAKITPEFWDAVRPNIEKISDLEEWWRVAQGPVTPIINDKEFAQTAADLLPAGAWDDTTWDAWISAIKEKTNRKGKELFMPIRLGLTGMEHGPEMKNLLPLIGRDRAIERLKTAA